jgi:hypothetical protein
MATKKDLWHTINQQASKIGSLEEEITRLRNQKQNLELRAAKHDADIAIIRKILGTEVQIGGGGGSGGTIRFGSTQ